MEPILFIRIPWAVTHAIGLILTSSSLRRFTILKMKPCRMRSQSRLRRLFTEPAIKASRPAGFPCMHGKEIKICRQMEPGQILTAYAYHRAGKPALIAGLIRQEGGIYGSS